LCGELARLVEGVKSDSSSVGVVEFCPERVSSNCNALRTAFSKKD
jgi:hypothetical protein